jgi:uroporphyrinogen decarboxylase
VDVSKALLRTLDGERLGAPPIWLMRQAGRYLPEYRRLRTQAPSFLDFCYSPELAAEATLQPIRRFDLDAAILFSDILVIPDALGQKVWFEEGEGPRLQPLDVSFRPSEASLNLDRLAPVYETIERVKSALPPAVALIGFCGAPWTLATYMIAGRGTPDQHPARLFAYREPAAFEALIALLVEACIVHLSRQIDAGVEAVQIFDSWAGVLPSKELRRWCLEPVAAIARGVKKRHPTARIIVFPRGVGARIENFAQMADVACIGLDTAADVAWAARTLPLNFALQGNLDPCALTVGGDALDRAVDVCLSAFSDRRHVMNLGHGVTPATPPDNVEKMISRVRRSEM